MPLSCRSRRTADAITLHRGQPSQSARRALRPAGRRLRRADDQHTPPLAGRRPRTSSISANSAAAISSAPCRTGSSPRRSAASCTRTTRRTRGRSLRFVQEYFLVACSLADIVARFLRRGNDWPALPDKVAIQLNDTHPAMAVAELMRILLDQARLGWDEAWDLTVRTLAYTNHTLLPEALEKWPVELFEAAPAAAAGDHLRDQPAVPGRGPGGSSRRRGEGRPDEPRSRRRRPAQVRMANLAIVGTHSTNGVAAIHSELLRTTTVRRFRGDVPRAVQQQDQRRDPPALAAAGQPGPGGDCSPRRSARAGSRTSSS